MRQMGKRLRYGVGVLWCAVCLAVLAVNAAAEEPGELRAAMVWDTGLCCRIGCMPEGTRLTVLETGEEYLRVDCWGLEGCIRAELTEMRDGGYYVNCETGTEDTISLAELDAAEAAELRGRVEAAAQMWTGTPYVYGGTGPSGFDCSGFVQYVFAQCGVELSRVVTTQLADGMIVPAAEMVPGDLVIFENTYDYGPSHIGIYLGDDQFIHASSSRGVVVSDLTENYYAEHFLCARRVIPEAAENSKILMEISNNGKYMLKEAY